ncbi:hypothetical protein [Leptolyngbya sp. NIES-2104]|uniref:hypothetical protein n=1 Tax=Leptolyngbya sp. NIES-2104 TaxID=1552121 RepID=UPI0006EC8652|nr:hypothetical protein [Leptolyngbya sp. NIES-2104]GAP95939.1 permease of the drug/metabolite transporter (DMT) superfamily [Leptolyngbya sp. NIES-2104]
MSSSASQSQSKSISVQAIVFAEILLAVAALLFFLLFSVPDPGQTRPDWYSYGASAFEIVAFFSASWLCFRNWNSPQIVSGRRVWLGIGLGMLCYGIGTILFTYWETYLGREADVSLGDFFYVPTYLFLAWGMIMAFADRRLNLDLWQWLTVGAIAAVSIAFATWLTLKPDTPSALLFGEPAIAQTAPVQTKPTPRATVAPTVRPSPVVTPAATPKPVIEEKKIEDKQPAKVDNAPEWVKSVEEALAPLKSSLDYFYVLADVFILIIATTLLLAFWGGRFSQSWRMIAAAAFCLYIADMWFKYATTRLENYQSGGLVEIFWIFSGVLFGIGAALEYDLSRSRRSGSRRRA